MTKQERYDLFRDECKEAGLDVEDYSGRNYYEGPAVRAADFDEECDIIRATTGRLQTDNLGRGSIVYPR